MKHNRKYKLLKDLPDGAIVGDIYVDNGYGKYTNQRMDASKSPVIEHNSYFSWQVETSTDFFEEVNTVEKEGVAWCGIAEQTRGYSNVPDAAVFLKNQFEILQNSLNPEPLSKKEEPQFNVFDKVEFFDFEELVPNPNDEHLTEAKYRTIKVEGIIRTCFYYKNTAIVHYIHPIDGRSGMREMEFSKLTKIDSTSKKEEGWEILSYKNKETGEEFQIASVWGNPYYKDGFKEGEGGFAERKEVFDIFSVKRISDGEVFSIGDRLKDMDDDDKIVAFKILKQGNENEQMRCVTNIEHEYFCDLDCAEKAPTNTVEDKPFVWTDELVKEFIEHKGKYMSVPDVVGIAIEEFKKSKTKTNE